MTVSKLNIGNNLDVSGVLRIRGLDVSQNIHLLDASANSYEDRLDGIDISFSQTIVLHDVSANDISASKIQIIDNLIIPTSQP